jgi:hypothetical protein
MCLRTLSIFQNSNELQNTTFVRYLEAYYRVNLHGEDFMLDLLFDPEDGSDMYFRNFS